MDGERIFSLFRDLVVGSRMVKGAVPDLVKLLQNPEDRTRAVDMMTRGLAELGRDRAVSILKDVLARLEEEGGRGGHADR